MRVLKLHHPTGHPYWQADEYTIELPNGQMIYPEQHLSDNLGGYRVFWNSKGVFVQQCSIGSGYGKVNRTGVPPKLLVSGDQYDAINFVGTPLEMSRNLRNDLAENRIQ